MIASKFARIISMVFHPALIPAYIVILLLTRGSLQLQTFPVAYKMTIAGVVILTTLIFPLFITWMLIRLNIISSVFMSSREERVYPVLAMTVFYYLTYFLLKGISISLLFSYFMLGATLLSILSLALNFYWKISLHMVAAGSFAGFFLGLSLNFGVNLYTEILSGIVLAGIIGFARLKTESHHPAEIYSGFVMGFSGMAILMFLL
jgi:hypothetical protein